jgi:hypothetical protein
MAKSCGSVLPVTFIMCLRVRFSAQKWKGGRSDLRKAVAHFPQRKTPNLDFISHYSTIQALLFHLPYPVKSGCRGKSVCFETRGVFKSHVLFYVLVGDGVNLLHHNLSLVLVLDSRKRIKWLFLLLALGL